MNYTGSLNPWFDAELRHVTPGVPLWIVAVVEEKNGSVSTQWPSVMEVVPMANVSLEVAALCNKASNESCSAWPPLP